MTDHPDTPTEDPTHLGPDATPEPSADHAADATPEGSADLGGEAAPVGSADLGGDATPEGSAEVAGDATAEGSAQSGDASAEVSAEVGGDATPEASVDLGADAAADPEAVQEASAADAVEDGASAGEDEDYLPPGQTEVPVGDEVVVDDETMRRALEAILMVTDEPLPVLTLARAVGRPTGDVSAALLTLADEYTEQGRGFELREVGGGWRYYTRVEAAPYVERFVLDGQQARLTQAALETLAVVAYKQPVSRARVSAIRGVNVDGVMRTLIARGLVEEAGADTESQATLYRTTSYFLERMGMQSLDDLPELAPYLPDMDDIEEELAAQTLPPTSSEDGTTPAGAGSTTPTETDGTTPAEPDELARTSAEGAEQPTTAEQTGENEPSETTEPTHEPAERTDELADDDAGIDGDLATEEPVELDVDHEPGELTPSEEFGADDEATERSDDVAESAHGAAEPANGAGEVVDGAVEPDETAEPTDEPGEEDAGIDGDVATEEPAELDVDHEPGELTPSEEFGADRPTESADDLAEHADEPAEPTDESTHDVAGPTDEPGGEDAGIDGDLETEEPVELDVEHEPEELTPSEEFGADDEAAESDGAAERADERAGADERAEAVDGAAEVAGWRGGARDG
ncbi:SMC-Scp complex subunit ScpB [Kribbella sp. CA-247076]|uniref:SMC-Scp complex subunit ScpB n=1 Tax=Kribbella sp. CA-247076 TaxID=3239941 RepID=UPI003D8AE197